MLTRLYSAVLRTGSTILIGYFWLGLCWFLIRPNIPDQATATGVISTAYRLANTLAKPGLVVVFTIVAYLLGTLTTLVFLPLLRLVPRKAYDRTIFVRRLGAPHDVGRSVGHRPESTAPYVFRGILPAALYDLNNFRETYVRLCTEARFLWLAPIPLAAISVYLSFSYSPWFIGTTLLAPLLMLEGARRFRLACHLLSQAGLAWANAAHRELMADWDRRSRRSSRRDDASGAPVSDALSAVG